MTWRPIRALTTSKLAAARCPGLGPDWCTEILAVSIEYRFLLYQDHSGTGPVSLHNGGPQASKVEWLITAIRTQWSSQQQGQRRGANGQPPRQAVWSRKPKLSDGLSLIDGSKLDQGLAWSSLDGLYLSASPQKLFQAHKGSRYA